MIVAIAGATGLTGSLALKKILEIPQVTGVVTIGRRATGVSHPKLREVYLSDNRLTESVSANAFICCLGTTIKKAGSKDAFRAVDLKLPIHIARQLQSLGCETAVVVSAMGADKNSNIFYSKVKGEMEEGMKELGFKSLTFLRPALIEGDREEARAGEKIGSAIFKVLNPILKGPLKNYASVDANLIADRLVQVATSAQPGNFTLQSSEI